MGRREFIAGIGATCPSLHLASLLAAQVAGITMAASRDSTLRTFRCDDGTNFVVAFYRRESRAHVQLDGKAMTLPRRLSLSDARYSAGGITLRIKEKDAALSRGRKTTECSSS
jgi:membrane-bound inhibitor of C-type lysozyme